MRRLMRHATSLCGHHGRTVVLIGPFPFGCSLDGVRLIRYTERDEPLGFGPVFGGC